MRAGNVLHLGVKELWSLARDPMMIGLIAFAFTASVYTGAKALPETLNKAPIAIVDYDQSPLSQRIAGAFYRPQFLPPEQISPAEMDARMDAGLDTFAVVIPPDFQRDVLAGRRPTIQLNVDATRMSQGYTGSGYVQAIVDGEVFQIVVSRRFELETQADALDVYRVLRATNPSPYMYLFNFVNEAGEPFEIVGSSPEALVTVNDGHVVTHPIAGSRPRGANYEEDQLHEKSLVNDQKERAEHLMLVDLSRNDLSKVCQAGSVEVTQFMEVERFSHIMHLVSNVVGKAREDVDAYDVLAATFPAGTLSGAPKPRALQLLDQYEPYRRGIYGGVVGYLDFAGDMDMAIAIRSALLKGGRAYVQAGGGIVNDSKFADEALETVNKAAAPLRAVWAAQSMHAAHTTTESDESK